MSRRLTLLPAVLAGGLFALLGGTSATAQREPGARVPESVRAQAAGGRRVRVIVGVRATFVPEGTLGAGARAAQRANIRERLRAVMSRLPAAAIARGRAFTSIPYFAAEVDAVTLLQLQQDPDVTSIEEDVAVPPTLEQSTAIVGATTAWSAGFTGSGWTVAILDTGVDKTHSFMGGRVVSEACYSNAAGGGSGTSLCPGGASSSTASGSGVNCTDYGACSHGTHVAGIAAGAGSTFSGVAPAAGVIAIQVFTGFPASDPLCGGVACALSFTSDQIAGLEHVLALRDTFNIAAANMSLGGGRYSDQAKCDADNSSRKAIIDSLRSAGIATVVSSGNNGFADSLSTPACISSAVSVASTTKLDEVSSFSNAASFLSLLAPGSQITSSVPGGFSSFNGTSMAAPHVAGAWALLKQRKPWAGVTEILTALRNTGVPVIDPLSDLSYPRIGVYQAMNSWITGPDDFDGDGKGDIAVYRPSTGMWYVVRSSFGTGWEFQWGWPDDIPVAADYDGDGQRDVAVFRPSDGVWYIVGSATGIVTRQWGLEGDVPVPADYDGDGRADVALYRPSSGVWYIIHSSLGTGWQVWGQTGDVPVPGDYDADGRTDVGVYRPSTGVWYISHGTGIVKTFQWGLPTDIPVPADYDGDGRTDVAIYRPSTGVWYVVRSSTGTGSQAQWGWPGDVPVPADYDGDGRADITVYRPSTGTWYQLRTTTGTGFVFGWGADGDIPLRGSSR